VATGRYGPVTIVNFNPAAPFVGRDAPAPLMFDLVVSGSPSAVRDKLMNDLGIDPDLLEPWVLIVLLYAKNWCVHWNQDEHSNKSALCADLDWMINKAEQLVEINVDHFSGLPLQRNLLAIYSATEKENHRDFSDQVGQLRQVREMIMDLTMAEITTL